MSRASAGEGLRRGGGGFLLDGELLGGGWGGGGALGVAEVFLARGAGGFFFCPGAEGPLPDRIPPIALGHVDVVSARKEHEPARARIRELPQRSPPARADDRRPAGGMIESI